MSTNYAFPSTGIPSGERALLLAIDDVALPIRKNLCLYLSKPNIRPEPVLRPSLRESNAPDNCAAHFYGTVLQDGGRFRMWYYACHWGANTDWPPQMARQLAKYADPLVIGPLCYAESDDGITWHKPALGQVLFKGSRENNALALPHAVVAGATVIKDEEDPDPSRRYKMVYEYFPDWTEPHIPENGNLPSIATAVSPDGLQWTVTGMPFAGEFVEHASFYRHNGRFIVNSQNIDMQIPGEGATRRGREGYARFSHDFDHWVDGHVDSFLLPEPRDPAQRGVNGSYDQVHLGVGAASFGTVCVGLYGRWHNAHFHDAFGDISCDQGLVVSNDGLHFREPVQGHIFIAKEDSPATPVPGKHLNTVLCQANGILNVGDETRIYHGRWRNTGMKPEELPDYSAEVALATLPRDRWGALGLYPGVSEGWLWTALFTVPENASLTLNAEGAAGIRVEIADEQCRPIPGNIGACGPDGLDSPVRWEGQPLAALAGKTVRLRIIISSDDSRLYALNLSQ
ncbi:MAG: hypothetical protein ACYC6A_10990 [Armatimonadota bacterium]